MELTLDAAASFGEEGLQVAARVNAFLPEQVCHQTNQLVLAFQNHAAELLQCPTPTD